MSTSLTKRVRRTVGWGTLLIVVVLVATRAALPYAIERYVNRTLDRIPEYDGRIGDVDLSLIRGAYSIQDVELVKTTGKVPVPLVSAPLVEFSIEWRAIFQGKLVGEILIKNPRLNFVNGDSERDAQLAVDNEWLKAVKDLFPLRINKFEIINGEVHYKDFISTPVVNVTLHHVTLTGTNFNNTRTPIEKSDAVIEGSGIFESDGQMKVSATVQPAKPDPTFKLKASVEHLGIANLNDFLHAYADVDAESGSISVYVNMQAENKRLEGTVKPLVTDLKVSKLNDGPLLQTLWEGVIGVLTEIFKNQRHDQLGAVVPFSGSIDNVKVKAWPTTLTLLRNAFVRALKPGIESKESKDVE